MTDSSPRSDEVDESTAAAAGTTERGAAIELGEPPPVIGRYRICARIGHGGMGSVHLAHDDELDRAVALKVVLGDRLAEATQLRLLREAQALARLSHPNVVAVYEAGVARGRVFVAMELVRGVTLTRWALEGEPRSWREVLAMFRLAGRGLEAAHAAGIVHRDFKPSNVMIAEGGEVDARVKLVDFGIALEDRATSGEEAQGSELEPRLTRTGAVLGTVPYLSPEQHLGGEASPAADQYAFCVSLYQCLSGHLPFLGQTHERLAALKQRGAPRRPTVEQVPDWLWAVIVRGLAPAPAERFASMTALLGALTEPRRRVLPWVIGVFGVAVVGAWALRSEAGPTCDGDARVAATYDADARAAIVAAFDRTGLAYAGDVGERVVGTLDRYGAAWADAYRVACRAHAEGSGDAQLDRTMACLERRRADLGALIDVLRAADAQVMRSAITAAHGLAPIEACEQSSRPAAEQDVAAISRARALRGAGRYDDALAEARIAVTEGGTLEGRLEVARALIETGALAEAETEGTAVFFAAREAGNDEVARGAGLALARIVGNELARPDEGLEWIRHARALPIEVPGAAADLLQLEATMLQRLHRLDEAQAGYAQVVALIEAEKGALDAELAIPLNNLGAVAAERADFEGALAYYRRSLAIKEAAYGARHPFVASSISNIGNVYNQRGEPERALELYRQADAIRSAALGPDHPEVIISQLNTAVSLIRLGRFEEAYPELLTGLERVQRVLGPDHPYAAMVASNLGSVSRSLGRLDEAAGWLEQAIAIDERIEGADGNAAILPLVNLGNVRLSQGDAATALTFFERAHRAIGEPPGDPHPSLSHVLIGEAQALLVLDRADAALPIAERAHVVGRGGDAVIRGDSTFVLARACWATGARPRARELAAAARAEYARAPDPATTSLSELERWITEHR